MEEKWKVIKEAPFYEISDQGRVRSLSREVKTFNGKVWCFRKIPTRCPLAEKDIRGYKNVSIIQYSEEMRPIKRYMRQVHRLVLENFNPVEEMKNLQVNHKNGIKGDNRLENLEWITAKENTNHAHQVLKHHKDQNGEKNSMAKLTNEKVIEILKELKTAKYGSISKIAKKYDVSYKTIQNIKNNKSWKHIDRANI